MANDPKLTPTQAEIMRWLSKGWDARVSHGDVVEINGKKVCRLSTMTALEKRGLVYRDADTKLWAATEAGRALNRT